MEEAVAQEYARQQSLASAKRLALSRQLTDTQHGMSDQSNPSRFADPSPPLPTSLSQLPPHLINLASSSPPTITSTLTTCAATAALGTAAPMNVAPLIGMPRPGEANQE